MPTIWVINLIAVFLLCVLLAGFMIPQILLIAYRKQLYDEPDERKIHKLAVPRLGGMAFALVVFFSLVLVLGLNLSFGANINIAEGKKEVVTLAFSFCSIIILYIIGIADDLIGIKYRAKFVAQIVCALLLVVGGLSITNLYGIAFIHNLPALISIALTVLVIVFIINSINLIDGIDGLASGLCSVAFITYAVTFCKTEHYIYAACSLANLGVLLPFFYYNVFGKAEKQTKIFMGDTGALTIGISICILSFKILQCVPSESSSNFPNAFVIAFAPLIIPCFDVVRVYIRRLRTGKNPFLPDKTHIHHKLLAIGLGQRSAMILIVAISLSLTFLNCVGSMYININFLLIFDALFVTLGNIWLSKRIYNKNQD